MKRVNLLILALMLCTAIVLTALVGREMVLRRPILLQGRVECTTYRAASKIPGRIAQMMVREGQRVEQGEVLYTLTTPELDARLAQTDALRSAAEALDEQVVAGARRQQIEAARALWQRAKAARTVAEQTYARMQNLYSEGVATAQQRDEAEAQAKAMTAGERAAYAEYSLALAGATREERSAAAAKVRQAQGAVEEVESYIRDATVTAPVAGEVATVAAEVGELVGEGVPVVSILATDDVWVTFNIRETLLPKIRLGERLWAQIPALGSEVELEVEYIAPQADFATWNATRAEGGFDVRTFEVRLRPMVDRMGLRAGMSAIVDYKQLL